MSESPREQARRFLRCTQRKRQERRCRPRTRCKRGTTQSVRRLKDVEKELRHSLRVCASRDGHKGRDLLVPPPRPDGDGRRRGRDGRSRQRRHWTSGSAVDGGKNGHQWLSRRAVKARSRTIEAGRRPDHAANDKSQLFKREARDQKQLFRGGLHLTGPFTLTSVAGGQG